MWSAIIRRSKMVMYTEKTVGGAYSSISTAYEEAIKTLNSLQNNADTVRKAVEETRLGIVPNRSIPDMVEYCHRVALDDEPSSIDKLSVIHVSGTKGKGSTCAFVESILRHNGFKTGFFSSPHLIEVRERIRLNGVPLSRESFAQHFQTVYDRLLKTKDEYGGKMPAYFRFLTLMAFQVFLHEEVDVAILEVGIGGEYDCTNVVRQPVVCGVASLDLDHTSMLGETVDKIAWHKAGIFKRGTIAVTVEQPREAMDVLRERALERGTTLLLAPNLGDYEWGVKPIQLGLDGEMQHVNASLALQLSAIWMRHRHQRGCRDAEPLIDEREGVARPFAISEKTATGLRFCRWPGRNHIVRQPAATYYLDGAHTERSVRLCASWFRKASNDEAHSLQPTTTTTTRVLIFNSTGDRNVPALLAPLAELPFHRAIFCPNLASSGPTTPDQTSMAANEESQRQRCCMQARVFESLSSSLKEETQGIHVCQSVQEAIECALGAGESASFKQILITGSIHLVGCALRLLDPHLNE